MCYPPFNNVTNTLVGWSSRDFPQFSSSIIHITLNSLILVLMAVYTLASVSLGWKASNLTNRGIVTTGVYRFIRHPAYTAKNLAWWIGSIPVIIVSFSQ
jgi:protein-S-isoprenylcysteine O-methyltransferase Ste14